MDPVLGQSELFMKTCFRLMAHELYDKLSPRLNEVDQAWLKQQIFEYFDMKEMS